MPSLIRQLAHTWATTAHCVLSFLQPPVCFTFIVSIGINVWHGAVVFSVGERSSWKEGKKTPNLYRCPLNTVLGKTQTQAHNHSVHPEGCYLKRLYIWTNVTHCPSVSQACSFPFLQPHKDSFVVWLDRNSTAVSTRSALNVFWILVVIGCLLMVMLLSNSLYLYCWLKLPHKCCFSSLVLVSSTQWHSFRNTGVISRGCECVSSPTPVLVTSV